MQEQQLQLTQEQNELLNIPRIENEIKETVFVLESGKAYAPNGFAVEFLNTFESEIISGLQDYVTKLLREDRSQTPIGKQLSFCFSKQIMILCRGYPFDN